MTGENLKYILAVLNSTLFKFTLLNIYLEGDTFQSKNKIIQNLLIIKKILYLRRRFNHLDGCRSICKN